MSQPSILVTGALGQIGRVLIDRLVHTYGADAVLATDLVSQPVELPCTYETLDATSEEGWQALHSRYQFTQIYHLVAVLSARGEADPWRSWDINMKSWRNALACAQEMKGCRVFFPSSIAAYGPPLPKAVDESMALWPTTSYGISKAAGEQWGHYAAGRFGVDVRSLRLPGVIGYQTKPGGGTTDYAVDIYHHAVADENFTCFLKADTTLPMIYMDDVLRGIIELMQADRATLVKPATGAERAAVFNLSGFSVSPQEIAQSIQQLKPKFEVSYVPDHRQQIADTWPAELIGEKALTHWGWKPKFDLEATTADMMHNLQLAQQHLTTKP